MADTLTDSSRSCATGGSSAGVYRWVERFGGIPAAGCFPYLATDGLGCAPDTICRNCMPSNEDGSETECWAVPGDAPLDAACCGDDTCAVSPYPRIAVAAYGRLPGAFDVGAAAAAEAMRAEIARAGPITCNVDATTYLRPDIAGVGHHGFSKERNASLWRDVHGWVDAG